ncbi:MAG: hypothetical protein O9282_12250 [Flavobacterium sp.]|uniref:hypothetical protein n=1 Tax=Flavobacterium sp. TaxID=239 RepID=UPI0022CA3D2D|nr:hypothetical protein [Flavobacterium sp.]MCZ8022128.1 hypothetical protein [Cytophagales bacterium]MCZ8332074.1 hypothetical protein [Flavobacterium sp.]
MTKEKIKYVFMGFGFLDFLGFYFTYENVLNMFLTGLWVDLNMSGATHTIFTIITTLNSILVVSLILSGLLCIFYPTISFFIYYFQFPLRLIFFTMTFGFILHLPGLQVDSWAYKFILAFVIGLEVFRLIFTLKTKKKYFSATEAASP